MNERDLFVKNNILSTEFSRYVLEHPEFARRIPQDALVVLLPENDPELCQMNLELARSQREPDQSVVYVHVEKLAPQHSRLVHPRLGGSCSLNLISAVPEGVYGP